LSNFLLLRYLKKIFYNSVAELRWEKYEIILRGANGRKFVYHKGEWRLIFTFFPTDRVVDERYALKNKVLFRHV
ncbi:hypothetical protein DWZ35_23585, partial [Bacteroides caccae]